METIVDVEHDPVPLVLIMANVLRRNESDPKRARLLAHTAGRVVFRSASDPQVVTIEFRRGRVMVTRGAAPDADMTIVAGLATMSDEKPPKPRPRRARRLGSSSLAVNSLHHQVIDRPGDRVRIVAGNSDGHPEAIDIDGAPAVLGVQWHPELLRHRREQLALFQSLISRD